MKMDRNIDGNDGCGKYLLVNLRKLNELCGHPSTFNRWTPAVQQALDTLEEVGVLQWGRTGSEDEFFLLKLKDRHAKPALEAYAASILPHDMEFSDEVAELAKRAGIDSPFCKEPD